MIGDIERTHSSVLLVVRQLAARMELSEALTAAGVANIPCGTEGFAREALSREQIAMVIFDSQLSEKWGTTSKSLQAANWHSLPWRVKSSI